MKAAEYSRQVPEYVGGENWVSSQEDDITVFVSGQRDDTSAGRRHNAGFSAPCPSAPQRDGFCADGSFGVGSYCRVGCGKHGFLEPYLEEMAGLVRARKVYLHGSRSEEHEAEWHESELDGKKIYLNIH